MNPRPNSRVSFAVCFFPFTLAILDDWIFFSYRFRAVLCRPFKSISLVLLYFQVSSYFQCEGVAPFTHQRQSRICRRFFQRLFRHSL